VEEERTKDSSKLPCGANEEGKDKSKAKQRKAKPKEPKQKLVYYYIVALQFSLSRRV
jgi:hypothetical protein